MKILFTFSVQKQTKTWTIFQKILFSHCKNFTEKYIDLGGVCFDYSDAKDWSSNSPRTKIWMFKQNESQSSSNLVNTIAGKISELRKKNREELNYNQSMEVAPLRSLDDFVLAKARFQVRIFPASSVVMHNWWFICRFQSLEMAETSGSIDLSIIWCSTRPITFSPQWSYSFWSSSLSLTKCLLDSP